MMRVLKMSALVAVAALSGVACGSGGTPDKPLAEPADGKPAQSNAVPFSAQGYEPVLAALGAAGLTICDDRTSGGSFAGDYESRVIGVSTTKCPSNDPSSGDFSITSPGLVVVRSFNARTTRDAAAVSGFGDGLVYWSWADKVVSVTESSRPEIVVAVERAMSNLEAVKTGDKRNTGE